MSPPAAAPTPALDSTELRTALLELFYPAPGDIWTTREGHERYHHRDLAQRARVELERERQRLRLRLLFDDAPDAWLLQRLTRLDRALTHAR